MVDREGAAPSAPASAASAASGQRRGGLTVGGGWRSAFGYWWTTYRRTWWGGFVSSFCAPLLYLGAMGYGLGRLVDAGPGGGIPGVDYVAFVAPGLLVATAMTTAVGESTYPVMGSIKWQRHYHAMLATPLGVPGVLGGHLVFVASRLVTVSVVYLLVASLLGALRSPWMVLGVPVAVLVGLAFAAPIFAFSALQDNDQGFNVLFRFLITPMFLFSGTFFPVEQLPGWMQPVAWATPLWHGVELSRSLSLGTTTAVTAVGHVGYLLLWVVGGAVVARWAFTRRLVS